GWSYVQTAPEIERKIKEAASAALPETLHTVTTQTNGRDIRVMGIAQDAREREAVLSAIGDVFGRRIVVDDLDVLQVVSPYTFSVLKTTGGLAVSGHVPTEAMRMEIAATYGVDTSVLNLAAGQPERGWAEAWNHAKSIADQLEVGRVDLSDTTVVISGAVPDPFTAEDIEAAARRFPSSFDADVDLVVPQTTPYTFKAVKSENGFLYEGFAPSRADEVSMTALLSSLGQGQLRPAAGAPNADWADAVRIVAEALSIAETGTAEIESSTVAFSAAAPTLEDQDIIQEIFEKLPEGYRIGALTVTVPPAVPYIFNASKTDDGIVYEGYVPTNALRTDFADFIGQDSAEALDRRAGMPDGFWPDFVKEGIAAIGALERGEMRIEDRTMRLSGLVANPVMEGVIKSALSDLPAGYAAEFDLELEDDGQPTSLALAYQDGSLDVSGKAPQGLDLNMIQSLLSVDDISGAPRASVLDGLDFYRNRLAGLRAILPNFSQFNATFSEVDTKISAVGKPGLSLAPVEAQLISLFGEDADVTLQETSLDVEAGTVRTNELTGLLEIFRDGFWQPFRSESEVLANCSSRVSNILSDAKIEFATASSEIDPTSFELIDELADIMADCLANTTAQVLVGGHTDSDGDAAANLQLSEARANAVRDALLSRGIPATRVTATGFGETNPIASNDTAEGRAQNRRTTFVWDSE
ncbi:MAG: OmpA family protein, partial [Pseudomonadota bacterium]